MVTTQQLEKAMHYGQYRNLLEDLMAHNKTTGPNQSEAYIQYAKLNLQRMLRLDKTAELNDEMKNALAAVKEQYIWLVLTEGWCGDAAQNLPVMAMIEKACPNIQLRLLLRDEHVELMDQYLTNGTRSIPKLICIKQSNFEELFTWGPRPAVLQALIVDLKAKGGSVDEKALMAQKWYNADKTQHLQQELITLIKQHLQS